MTLVRRLDEGGLTTLTLNRPEKHNALTVPMFALLRQHVADIAAATDTVGCVLLRGAGRSFCSGNDLAAIAAGEQPPEPHFQARVIEELAALPQPVVAAVHGHCYAGGLELALAADLILAAESARFADVHAAWAMTPVWGMSQRLPRRVGAAKAKELMFTGRVCTGREAEAMGLANSCWADGAFDGAVEETVRRIVDNSWFTHRMTKRLLAETETATLRDGLAYELAHSGALGPDAADRLARFGRG
ncbi:enoyl-CoA hydratase/isomerase family protein [Phytohabitans sp. ZYX-F-186]|uniref:Enoyl-CoA hydratase/isomerase family protein n=1 Tax=Phytohabitans maris TaxID=3071409 RepID=A0ABU0ZCT8_9ACTN|nr:enoyl-CoA hydratase/isomerase family protein [Phytohabitans sp. ZYX-F-186]MDQ7903742.1 enoyl-CoA hydratase/isomerase family protein [Phytohabitans sp. ZYX-F-186]